MPGTGISAHVDDPKQFGEWVCGVSLSSGCEMTFNNRETKHEVDVFLERCSLYVMTGESRYNYTHCIKPRKSDKGIPRERRLSITLRYLRSTF